MHNLIALQGEKKRKEVGIFAASSRLFSPGSEQKLAAAQEDRDPVPSLSRPFVFCGKTIQFFHFHEGLLGLEDTKDLIIRSRTGLRFPLRKNFLASAQFHYDLDNSPALGREKEDKKYILTLGYSW
ncbi:MAG: DUF481 domain-containing protein [Deltaproteobacteria bacterium]|nr:DUF481 domain-containing protein [Deltaproteobacteria bacterium]